MFEGNLGLDTATPCLGSVRSTSCNFFPPVFPLCVSLLSVVSCFLRQKPVFGQGRSVGGTSGGSFVAAGDTAGRISAVAND